MYHLRKKILPIVLTSMVDAENFSDHPPTVHVYTQTIHRKTQITTQQNK